MHTFWITGLSQSGKTTIAHGIAEHLQTRDRRVQILDGSEIRDHLGSFFGYSKEERMKVNRVLCTIAKFLSGNDVITLVTSISPHQETRDFNRSELDPYHEIYLECPVEVCIERDQSGMYKKALQGDVQHFVGVDDPYEVPRSFDCKIDTASSAVDVAVREAIEFVENVIAGK